MSARHPYVRPMDGWWWRDPFFVRYMIREATALFVFAYAVVLLVGVVRLAQGEAAYQGWLQALTSPWSLLFHLLLLTAFVYHTVSWFSIMPKTMAPIIIRGRKLPAAVITRTGLAAAAVSCVVLLLVAMAITS